MPKRGSSISGLIAPVPRKKQKNNDSTNGHDDEEQDENIPTDYGSYSSQLFKKCPDVNIFLVSYNKLNIFFYYISFIKLLVLFLELV